MKSDRVALEVTGRCWEVARILEPPVDGVVVVSPDDTGITQVRAKTDRLDARTLARTFSLQHEIKAPAGARSARVAPAPVTEQQRATTAP